MLELSRSFWGVLLSKRNLIKIEHKIKEKSNGDVRLRIIKKTFCKDNIWRGGKLCEKVRKRGFFKT